jgi:hypothetical protein
MSTLQQQERTAVRRVVAASLIGATIEWYDFFLYGVVAGIVFNKLYFPGSDPLVSTMLAYGTFAVGFLSRPIGGVIFGHFGDKLGRKAMLVMTLTIMGVATVLIGCIPTYEQIGVWAPITLLALRIAQGIGLGGEWGGAVLMAFEYAPKEKRGLYASIPQIGLALGLCGASGMVALLSYLLTDAQFLAWGWRVAFILSIVLVAVGMYIRLNVMETPEFSKVKKEGAEVKLPIKEVLVNYPGNVLAGMGARYIDGVFFNIFGVFSIAYLTQTLNHERQRKIHRRRRPCRCRRHRPPAQFAQDSRRRQPPRHSRADARDRPERRPATRPTRRSRSMTAPAPTPTRRPASTSARACRQLRAGWIAERGDTEELPDLSSEYGRQRAIDAELAGLRFDLARKPRRALPART